MSGMQALLGAAANTNQKASDDEDEYSGEFDTPPSPERKTAREVLRPTQATSPRRDRDRVPGSGRRPMTGNAALRGSMADLSAQSNAAREKLLRTSLPAFMNMNVNIKKKKKKTKPSAKFTKNRMNALSKPKKLPKAQFVKEEDLKNCKFKPKISRKSRQMINHDEDPDSFVYRMEAANYSHKADLERRRAEEAYNVRVDKKECPVCHLPQTYAEVESNQKKCERCDAFYRPKKTWAEVQGEFLKRLEDNQVEKVVSIQHKQQTLDLERTGALSGKGKKKAVKDWASVRESFLKRMEDDASSRKENKERLEKDAAVDPECTFQPHITAPSKSVRGVVESFAERTAKDIEERQARMEEAIRRHIKPPPRKYKSKTQKRVSKALRSLMAGKAISSMSMTTRTRRHK